MCKYSNWEYRNQGQLGKIKEFMRYVHEKQVPIEKLYDARTEFMNERCMHHHQKYKSQIRVILRHLIDDVARAEHRVIQEDVPTYHMNRDGEYVRVR